MVVPVGLMAFSCRDCLYSPGQATESPCELRHFAKNVALPHKQTGRGQPEEEYHHGGSLIFFWSKGRQFMSEDDAKKAGYREAKTETAPKAKSKTADTKQK